MCVYVVIFKLNCEPVESKHGSTRIAQIEYRVNATTPRDALNLAYASVGVLIAEEHIKDHNVFEL